MAGKRLSVLLTWRVDGRVVLAELLVLKEELLVDATTRHYNLAGIEGAETDLSFAIHRAH